ncbi:MAG: hypothetical protein JXB49_14375, partial [Bacteroidales bacterium]|nr:hypothetical protein [Bacteroidales bacterium]
FIFKFASKPKIKKGQMKTILQIILTVAILGVGYLLVKSIMKPIEFQREQEARYEMTIAKLKDIRSVQDAYKSKYSNYTPNFDDLVQFIKKDSIEIERPDGEIPDTLDLQEAIKLKLVKMVKTKIAVKDTIFKAKYPADSIGYVPFRSGIMFNMDTATIKTAAQVNVKVFEASVTNNVLLDGLDPQLIENLNDLKRSLTGFAGLKVGSLEEANNNAGNWE